MFCILSVVLMASSILSVMMSDTVKAESFVQPEQVTNTGPTLRCAYPAIAIDNNKVIHFAHTWMPYDDDTELPISDVYYGNNMMTVDGVSGLRSEKLYLDNSSVIGL